MASVEDTVAAIEKRFKRVVEATQVKDPERIPTGIFPFDLAMGGGFPMGRVSVVYGNEGSFKTSLCLKAIASCHRLYPDKQCIYFDLEHSFSEEWATKLGVDMDRLLVIRQENAEQTVDMIEALIYADNVGVLVVDSLAALITIKEIGANAEDALVGTQGLLINKLYRRVTHSLSRAVEDGRLPTPIFINQIRYKIGVMFGNPETMPGGPSFKFASSMTVKMYAKDIIDKDISEDLPAFKECIMTLQKWKVPVAAKKVDKIQIAVLRNDKYNLSIGESYDNPTILTYLKSMELFGKADGGGWDLTLPDTGEVIHYRVQDDLAAQMAEDSDFAHRVRTVIIDAVGRINYG